MSRRSLSGRVALWICGSTLVSLVIFAVVAFVVVTVEETWEQETGEEEDTIADARNEVLIAMAFAAPVGLALAAGGAVWLTRRALAPVQDAIRTAADITAEHLDRRLPVPAREDELRALVEALNGVLDRLERGFEGMAMFAADASHELRTPLAVVASELEVALRRPRTVAEWEASARTSLDELARLARLVDALLRLARADVVRPGQAERVDLVALLEQVVALQAPAAERAQVTVTGPTKADASAVAVDGDRDALASAFANLVGNAVRYTPAGGTVSVSIEPRGAAGVTVAIEDTGPGLAPDELEAIFRPFARGEQGKRADTPGLGLGLAIARRVVERHGGRLTAGARTGGGARFAVELGVPEKRS